MKPDKRPASPYLFVFIGIITVSFSSILIKWADAPAAIIGMYRLLFTVCLLLPWLWRARKLLRSIHVLDWGLLILSGIFLGLHFLFWIASLQETTIASSMIITALSPVFVVIGAFWLFRERITSRQAWSIVFAICGTTIVAWGDIGQSRIELLGDLSSLAGTLAVSGYMLAGQTVRANIPSSVYNAIVFFIGGIELGGYALIHHTRFSGYSPHNWTIFVLLAIVPTLFGHGLFNWLLKYLSAATIAMTTLGEPIGAIILAYLLLGQGISWWQIIGGMTCIVGVWLFLREKRLHAKVGPTMATVSNCEQSV